MPIRYTAPKILQLKSHRKTIPTVSTDFTLQNSAVSFLILRQYLNKTSSCKITAEYIEKPWLYI